MPLEQTNEQDDLVNLRVVMYGAPSSGKATTAVALGEGFGQTVQTFTGEDGNDYFRWMQYVGGRHEGKPICTQLIAIAGGMPGPIRTRLLRVAHVVLFVADTSPAGLEQSIQMFSEVEQVLDAQPAPRPRTIIQANKRDLDDAVALKDLISRLGIDEGHTVVETVATEGSGIRQALVYAVRNGLEHLAEAGDRTMVDGEDALSSIDPNELLSVLEQLHSMSAETAKPIPNRQKSAQPKDNASVEGEAQTEPADRRAEQHPEAALRIVERLPKRRENGTTKSAAEPAGKSDGGEKTKKGRTKTTQAETAGTDSAQAQKGEAATKRTSQKGQAKTASASTGAAKKGAPKKGAANKGAARKGAAKKGAAKKSAAKSTGRPAKARGKAETADRAGRKTSSPRSGEPALAPAKTAGPSPEGADANDAAGGQAKAGPTKAEPTKAGPIEKSIGTSAKGPASGDGEMPAPPESESVRVENQPPPPSAEDATGAEGTERNGTLLTRVKHLMRGS